MSFNIDFPTKPYVRQFIIHNFGDPADFSCNKGVNDSFRNCLSRPSTRYDARYNELSLCRYSTITKVVISDDDFYRYGWEISKTNIVSFGKQMERQAKFLMRNMVSYYSSFMMERDAILMFQNRLGFNEDTWSFDSIKKDYQRFGPVDRPDFLSDLNSKIEKILLVNLSNLGTISQNARKSYDRDRQTA